MRRKMKQSSKNFKLYLLVGMEPEMRESAMIAPSLPWQISTVLYLSISFNTANTKKPNHLKLKIFTTVQLCIYPSQVMGKE